MSDLSNLLRPNKNALIREAARQVELSQAATGAPKVVWAELDDTPEAFAKRVAIIRATHRGRLLAAVPYGFPTPPSVQAVPFSAKTFKLLHPDAPSRYRVASGGRGSGKSHAVATAIILKVISQKVRVLCAREIMRSLRESVHHLLNDKIDALGLTPFFEVTDREITCRLTGSEIIFAGLWANINTLKSLENISLVWIEEAESVSQRSIEVLSPTIRAPGSELWLSANPDDVNAPIQSFINGERPDVSHTHIIFSDNDWFPQSLEGERAYLQRVDDDAYRHVWLGECRKHSDAQIFKNKYVVEAFTPGSDWDGPYFGLDLGFAADPSVLTKSWVCGDKLYIEKEAWKLHCDIDRLPALLSEVPGSKDHTIRCDSARPETVSYLRNHGYSQVVSVEKWPDSVQDGVSRMRAFEQIVIHPSCEHTIDEFRLYSYRVDRLTGDVLTDIVDKNNHAIDSIRYGITPLIKSGGPNALLQFYAAQHRVEAELKTAVASRVGATVTDLVRRW